MRRSPDERKSFRSPFWLAASNFYVVAAAFSLAVFFLSWGALHDVNEEGSYIPAGIIASVALLSTAVFRAVVLRKVRRRLVATRRLDQNLAVLAPRQREESRNKLTLEQNSAILNEIRKKSEAAKVLSKYSEGHREAYSLCQEYLHINEREMRTVGPGSPRIAALIRGRQVAEDLHRYHMLQWAELEVLTLTSNSKRQTKSAEKIGTAQQALEVIGTAAQFYPNDVKLQQSADAILNYISGLKVADLMTKASRAAGRGKIPQAEKLYAQARVEIQQRPSNSPEMESIAARIDAELEKIQKLND